MDQFLAGLLARPFDPWPSRSRNSGIGDWININRLTVAGTASGLTEFPIKPSCRIEAVFGAKGAKVAN